MSKPSYLLYASGRQVIGELLVLVGRACGNLLVRQASPVSLRVMAVDPYLASQREWYGLIRPILVRPDWSLKPGRLNLRIEVRVYRWRAYVMDAWKAHTQVRRYEWQSEW